MAHRRTAARMWLWGFQPHIVESRTRIERTMKRQIQLHVRWSKGQRIQLDRCRWAWISLRIYYGTRRKPYAETSHLRDLRLSLAASWSCGTKFTFHADVRRSPGAKPKHPPLKRESCKGTMNRCSMLDFANIRVEVHDGHVIKVFDDVKNSESCRRFPLECQLSHRTCNKRKPHDLRGRSCLQPCRFISRRDDQ